MLQIPETMPEEHYNPINIHGTINLYLFIAFAAILIALGILFVYKAKKQELEASKRIKLAFGLFGIFFGVCRVFFILMFQAFTNPDVNYNLLANIAYSFGMIGFTCLIWALEKAKYETRYFFLIGLAITILTMVGILLNILNVLVIREFILIVIMLGTPIAGFFIVILYIQLIRMSTGTIRKRSIYSLAGFLIMVVGITMDGQFFLAIDTVPLWLKMDLVPIICIVGFLVFALNQL